MLKLNNQNEETEKLLARAYPIKKERKKNERTNELICFLIINKQTRHNTRPKKIKFEFVVVSTTAR